MTVCIQHQGLLEHCRHMRLKLRHTIQMNVIPLKCHRQQVFNHAPHMNGTLMLLFAPEL